jgi:hemolysin activation/secretion protein
MNWVGGGRLAAIMLAVSGAVPPAAAQAPTREEIERVRPEPLPPHGPRLKVETGALHSPCPLAEDRFRDVKVTIGEVAFDGLRGLPVAALRPSFESFLGHPVPVAAICEIRDAAASIIRSAGYVAAVQVPPQRIDGGTLRLTVLMARLVDIRVRGDARGAERRIAAYLGALKAQEVFNEHDAERYLLLARDLPGYDVRLTLRPADAAPGEVIGEVLVTRTPIDVDFSGQNFGSHAVGRWGGLLRAQFYGLTGLGDRTSLGLYSTAQTDEQQVLQASHDFRLGHEGLTLGGRFTYAWTHPSVPDIAVAAHTLLASAEAGYPFIRSQAATLRGAVGLDYINQAVTLNGAPNSRDRVRVAYLRADGEAVDRGSVEGRGGYSIGEPRWRLAGSLELRRGLDILDASKGCPCGPSEIQPGRADGDPTATVFRLSGVGEYRPIPRLAFILAPRFQYSAHPLLGFEEYSAGTYTVGRGYDAGTLTGDSGAGFQAELRYGHLGPKSLTDVALQPFVFTDVVRVWNEGDPARSLVSIGGGLRAAWGARARLDTSLAIPLSRVGSSNERPSPRLLVSLSTKLWPWPK